MALIIGLAGSALRDVEREYLTRRTVAGVILFTRNFVDRNQILELIKEIRSIRKTLLICVDQEGGRVQRFRPGFIDLPAFARIGALHASSPAQARKACIIHARAMTADMLAIGIDLSFSPVADLLRGNLAIGDRAFAENPELCARFVALYVHHMQKEGMPATLKHFPGHGSVKEDTHFDVAQDTRPAPAVLNEDLLPFATAILAGAKAIMTAHVSYPQIDAEVAGYSKHWLQEILRQGLGFLGVIISDDVGMAGGAGVGSIADRIKRHYRAGCDLILVCSTEATAEAMSQNLGKAAKRGVVKSLRGRRMARARRLINSSRMQQQIETLNTLLADPKAAQSVVG